jgi:hypothetical protein
MASEFSSAAQILAATGKLVGVTYWLSIEERRVDQFADSTGDH